MGLVEEPIKTSLEGKNKSVAFFPSLEKMAGNPYWDMLVSGFEKVGIEFIADTPNVLNKKWLDSNRKRIHVIHLHYCQLFYTTQEGRAKFSSVLRLASHLIHARMLGYRVVFTVHQLEPTYWLEPEWVDRFGHYVIIRLSERVIVHCQEAKRLMKRMYGRKKAIYVIGHPNYINKYINVVTKEQARKILNLSEEGLFVFTFLGGIRPNKGIDYLIRAFRNLKDKRYRLVIAGALNKPANYGQYLQALRGADSRISFHLKYVPDDEIQNYLNAADVVVLPFARILTSGSAILAMSFGRPVIAPCMGCLPELIETGAGWLFEPGNVESLTAVMKEAASIDLLQMGENAIKKVTPFSLESICKQMENVYFD